MPKIRIIIELDTEKNETEIAIWDNFVKIFGGQKPAFLNMVEKANEVLNA